MDNRKRRLDVLKSLSLSGADTQHNLSLVYAELKCPGPEQRVQLHLAATVTASAYARSAVCVSP